MSRDVLLPLLLFCGLAAADDTALPVPAPARCVTVRPLVLPKDAVCVQAGGPRGFSREPKAPYLTEGGLLVVEYLVPPKATDGPWEFRVDVACVCPDERHLLMTSYRLYNSAPEGAQPAVGDRWDHICRYESDTPCVFNLGTSVLLFSLDGKDGGTIERCERRSLDGKGGIRSSWQLFPELEEPRVRFSGLRG